jgi:hypothetical protein
VCVGGGCASLGKSSFFRGLPVSALVSSFFLVVCWTVSAIARPRVAAPMRQVKKKTSAVFMPTLMFSDDVLTFVTEKLCA